MTVKELKDILNNVDRGIVRDRESYDELKKVSVEYSPDGGVTVYMNFIDED